MPTFKVVLRSLSVAGMFLCSITAAQAATIEFFGSRDTFDGASAVPNPARCGTPAPPNLFLDLPAGPGLSNLGAFSHKDNHCTNVATGNIFNGLFDWDFGGGDSIFGTFLGTIKLPAAHSVASFSETFTVAGGTGQFLNSSGSFSGPGTVTFKSNGLADSHFDFRGTITTVPEPMGLSLLALSLCAVGVCARRKA